MGCIPSKAITRTMSIREELSHGFPTTTSTWEELLTSHGGNDQLFAFICSSNAPTKLRTSSFQFPSRDSEKPLETKYLGDAWDLIPDITSKAEKDSAPEAVGEADFTRFTRSKSCQMASEREELWLSPDENKLDGKGKSLVGSRSFHTIEEYDALLERIHRFNPWGDSKLQQSSPVDESPETSKDAPEKKSGIEEDANLDSTYESGWKRKAVAKGLKSLDLEFPTVARLGQRIHEGQVCSPGTYITPKFGSYNAPSKQEIKNEDAAVFSPELVAALEDRMRELEVEEESILREMDGDSWVEGEMQYEVKVL